MSFTYWSDSFYVDVLYIFWFKGQIFNSKISFESKHLNVKKCFVKYSKCNKTLNIQNVINCSSLSEVLSSTCHRKF